MPVRGKQIENSHPEDDVMIQVVRKLVEVQVVVLLNRGLVSVQKLGLHQLVCINGLHQLIKVFNVQHRPWKSIENKQ